VIQATIEGNFVGARITFPSGSIHHITATKGTKDSAHLYPHSGVDIDLFDGENVECFWRGKVVYGSSEDSPWGHIFGNSLIVSHGDGTRALYAHCQKILVDVGDIVEVGQVIALSGRSGFFDYGEGVRQVDPHLHLGLSTDSNPYFLKDADGGTSDLLDPLKFLSDQLGDVNLDPVQSPQTPSLHATAAHMAAGYITSMGFIQKMLESGVPKHALQKDLGNAEVGLRVLRSLIDAM